MSKKTKPRISVIVSAFNAEKYIRKCLKSLSGQTMKEIEVICIDDNSTDKTYSIMEEVSRSDPRFVISKNLENIGVSKTRNKGIELAQADLVMFCDADDYYEETMCEELYKAMQYSPKIDIGIAEIAVTYEAHRDMKYSDDYYYSLKFSGTQKIDDEVILNTDLAPTNKIFKKKILEENDIRFPENLRYEDAYFCVAYFCCSNYAYYVNEKLYQYIRHENSTMSDTWSKDAENDPAIEHLYIAFRLFDFLIKRSLIDKYNELYWELFYSFELFAINNSKTIARKKQVKKEAADFCHEHETYLTEVSPYINEKINELNSSGIKLNKVAAKKFLIKLMPTYRLQVENVQRLRGLKNNISQLNETVDDLSRKIR